MPFDSAPALNPLCTLVVIDICTLHYQMSFWPTPAVHPSLVGCCESHCIYPTVS